MKKPGNPAKTIGPISAFLLEELLKKGKTVFTLKEALGITKADYYATGNLLSKLLKKNIIARLKSGTYLVLQAGAENTQLKNWPIIARELAGGKPYFISHYSAMRLHGMTSHPLFDIYFTMPTRHPDKKISDLNYHFVYSQKEHFWGGEPHWVTKQEQVMISNLERTMLDSLERPELCGGVAEVMRGIWTKKKEIRKARLLKYSHNYRTKAAVKRLGFILELLQVDEKLLHPMQKLVKNAKDYVCFDPAGPKKGKYVNRWHLCINTDIDELKAGVWG